MAGVPVRERTELFADPTTQFDLRRLADFNRRRPKILMVKDLRPDVDEPSLPIVEYAPFAAIALGLVVGLLLSLVRAV
ncbi:MAG: hypothetical protein QN178_12730 [Armatimonadota bacterium]|nr:hypothetical protein [Armatimonadota bacterium]